jgi:hypothetical protein
MHPIRDHRCCGLQPKSNPMDKSQLGCWHLNCSCIHSRVYHLWNKAKELSAVMWTTDSITLLSITSSRWYDTSHEMFCFRPFVAKFTIVCRISTTSELNCNRRKLGLAVALSISRYFERCDVTSCPNTAGLRFLDLPGATTPFNSLGTVSLCDNVISLRNHILTHTIFINLL